jgi:cysteine desulfurase
VGAASCCTPTLPKAPQGQPRRRPARGRPAHRRRPQDECPKSIAALYIRDGVALEPLIGGGGQECGLRAGTENVALGAALGAAADLAADALHAGETTRLTGLRDQLQAELSKRLPDLVHHVYLHGHPTLRLPNTLNIRIDHVVGRDLLAAALGVGASTGSACECR